MSLTFNLILALFLLAPGLGMFAGVYTGGRAPFRPAPAEPGSIHALALVSIGALLCHALGAWLFVAMEAHCNVRTCIPVDFDPNPYETILDLREALATKSPVKTPPTPLSSSGVAWLFTGLLIIGFVGFLIGLLAMVIVNRTGMMRATVYGWADEVLRGADTKAHVFTAYVLTDTETDGNLLGYEGSLIDMRQSPSGEIRVVVLKDVEPFVVQMKGDSARRQKVESAGEKSPDLINVLTIEGANIKNIAFRAFLDPRKLTDAQYKRLEKAGELEVNDAKDLAEGEPILPQSIAVNPTPASPEAAVKRSPRKPAAKSTQKPSTSN